MANSKKEYPKRVIVDGVGIRCANEEQEACAKAGEPFPKAKVETAKKPSGPKEFPKIVKGDDGHDHVASCKEHEHAIKNGSDWEPEEGDSKETSVKDALAKKKAGPAEYPKMITVGEGDDAEQVKVRNAAEEALALGETPTENEPKEATEDEPVTAVENMLGEKVELAGMSKDELEDFALENFEVDLDKRESEKDLIAKIVALANTVDLDGFDKDQLLAYAKENFGVDLHEDSTEEELRDKIEALLNDDSE